MGRLHDAPFLTCKHEVVERFCLRYRISLKASPRLLISQIAAAFANIPYENLTKIIKADGLLNPSSAIRHPAELLHDHLLWGTGGTCFSLTAACVALCNARGIEAHPILADRCYGPDTHCGLVIFNEQDVLLLDPGYLLFTPTKMPTVEPVTVVTGYNTIELTPVSRCRVELSTIVKGNRKQRLTYKTSPVDAETFYRAWISSFAWEMMTYPVLTRCTAQQHIYLQGSRLAIRSRDKTIRQILTSSEQVAVIGQQMGIAPAIIAQVQGVIGYGGTVKTVTG